MNDVILQVIARIVSPFIQLYGIYIIVHGHLSPGGGFAGGTILGTSLILIALSYSPQKGYQIISRNTTKILESTGGLWFIVVGLVGMLLGREFLTNQGVFPLGKTGNLFSSGMVALLNIGIGMKVASTMVTLFYHLLEEGGE